MYPPRPPYPMQSPPPPPDPRQWMASMKSYSGAAILVLILYLFLWFPGLIANVLYLEEAKRNQRIAGHDLPGVGCLEIMLGLQIGGFVLFLICGACFFGLLFLDPILGRR